MNIKLPLACIACCLTALLAVGCGAQSESSTSSATTDMQKPATSSQPAPAAASSAPEPEPITFGTKEEGGATFTVSNKSGKTIGSFAVKQTGSDSYLPELAGKQTLPNGAEAVINIPVIEASTGESGKQTKPMADLRITTEDGTVYELHQIDFTDVSDATIRIEGDIAYLEYTSLASMGAVSTLEAEKIWREGQAASSSSASEASSSAAAESAETAASTEGTEQPAAETATAETVQESTAEPTYEAPAEPEPEPTYEEPAYEEPTYEEPTYEEPTYEEPVYEETYSNDDAAVGGGAEEECVPDIILR